MADVNLTEGDVIAVPAAATPQVVVSPNAGQTGYRGTLVNKGTKTVYFGWNSATVVTDKAAGAHKGWADAGEAIRIPQQARTFACSCAGAETSTLLYIGDGGV